MRKGWLDRGEHECVVMIIPYNLLRLGVTKTPNLCMDAMYVSRMCQDCSVLCVHGFLEWLRSLKCVWMDGWNQHGICTNVLWPTS